MGTGLSNRPDEAMERLAGLVTRLLGASVGLVSLVDDARQFFPGQVGLPAPLSDIRETPLEQSMCRTVVATGEILQIDAASADVAWSEHGAFTVLGVESYLGAPLTDVEGRVLGSLCAIEPTQRTWTAAERQILLDLAVSASSELRARIAANEAIEATRRVQMMADASAALISTMDSREAIESMLDVIVKWLGMWAFVTVVGDDDRPPEIYARHRYRDDRASAIAALVGNEAVRLRDMPTTASVLAGSVESVVLDLGQTLAAAARTGASRPIFDALGMGPLVIVPLALAGRITGALTIVGEPDRLPYDDVDVVLAGDLARRAAMTLSHAQQFDREKRIADELQRGLLPVLPLVDRIGVDAIYFPASAGIEVGGDWYDLVDHGDGSSAVVIGDVTGHSIRAAAAMGRLQTAVHLFAKAGFRPAQVLDLVDATARELLGDLLATCLVVRVQPADDGGWQLTLANAGHLPPVVVDHAGNARLLELHKDPLLGLQLDSNRLHRSSTAHVAAGSTLLLYTDGLIERRRESIDVALDRLLQCAARASHAPFEGWCERLMVDLAPDHRDDIACIALRFL